MKLKLLAAAPLLAVCALTSPLAMAVSADLQLNGEIAAGACNISITGGGVYDYGDIKNETLVAGGTTSLGLQTNTIDIVCAAPSYVGIRLQDNRGGTESDSASNNHSFGLGVDQAGNPIGVMGYRQEREPTIDGVAGGPQRVIFSTDGGNSWGTLNSSDPWFHEGNLIYSFDDNNSSLAPTPITTVSWNMQADTKIEDRNKLDVSREFNLDGSATIELVYL